MNALKHSIMRQKHKTKGKKYESIEMVTTQPLIKYVIIIYWYKCGTYNKLSKLWYLNRILKMPTLISARTNLVQILNSAMNISIDQCGGWCGSGYFNLCGLSLDADTDFATTLEPTFNIYAYLWYFK